MCGIFAFYNYPGERCDPAHLTKIASLAGQRGPDMCGLAWQSAKGETPYPVSVQTWPGTLQSKWEEMFTEDVRNASLVIGHARLATIGNPTDLANAQPICICDGANGPVVIAHNGTISNYKRIAEIGGFELRTGSDSEIIAQLLTRYGIPTEPLTRPVQKFESILNMLPLSPIACVALTGHHVFAVAFRLPLFFEQRPEGIYVGSVAWNATCKEIPDGHILDMGNQDLLSDQSRLIPMTAWKYYKATSVEEMSAHSPTW